MVVVDGWVSSGEWWTNDRSHMVSNEWTTWKTVGCEVVVNGGISERWIKRGGGVEKEIDEDGKLVFGKSNILS